MLVDSGCALNHEPGSQSSNRSVDGLLSKCQNQGRTLNISSHTLEWEPKKDQKLDNPPDPFPCIQDLVG